MQHPNNVFIEHQNLITTYNVHIDTSFTVYEKSSASEQVPICHRQDSTKISCFICRDEKKKHEYRHYSKNYCFTIVTNGKLKINHQALMNTPINC